ncbi:hypothetical protein Bca52824_014653 [Brassica carinata]|uniref:Uncharacterized protein n=1 Tax=Brassica carinata TaxID=52824 RepID=A0A8X7W2S2_BRACI|nr:hypothetical protein Bca52824_014653 [Brassica carinata]
MVNLCITPTNLLLQRWDQSRLGSDSEYQSLDFIIHPCNLKPPSGSLKKSIVSLLHIAQLWGSDPTYHSLVDPIVPELPRS